MKEYFAEKQYPEVSIQKGERGFILRLAREDRPSPDVFAHMEVSREGAADLAERNTTWTNEVHAVATLDEAMEVTTDYFVRLGGMG